MSQSKFFSVDDHVCMYQVIYGSRVAMPVVLSLLQSTYAAVSINLIYRILVQLYGQRVTNPRTVMTVPVMHGMLRRAVEYPYLYCTDVVYRSTAIYSYPVYKYTTE